MTITGHHQKLLKGPFNPSLLILFTKDTDRLLHLDGGGDQVIITCQLGNNVQSLGHKLGTIERTL